MAMTAFAYRSVRDTADPDLLRSYLDRAHARIDALARELAEEQALTRRLRLVIALGPYTALRRSTQRRGIDRNAGDRRSVEQRSRRRGGGS